MLRRRAEHSRDDGVWVDGRHCVADGDIVEVLRQDADGEQGFSFIRTAHNHEGYIRSQLLQLRPPPTSVVPGATVHRQDGEASTMLRQLPKLSREWGVWVKGHHVRFFESSSISMRCVVLLTHCALHRGGGTCECHSHERSGRTRLLLDCKSLGNQWIHTVSEIRITTLFHV